LTGELFDPDTDSGADKTKMVLFTTSSTFTSVFEVRIINHLDRWINFRNQNVLITDRRREMARRDNRMNVESLCRFLDYVLSRRPDEFGLVPSVEGRVPLKELLQALHEEEGWGHIRQAHINELLMGRGRGVFDFTEGTIVASERHFHGPKEAVADSLPKVLYTPVRPRAHPVVIEKGLNAPEGKWIVLSGSTAMAQRIGRRKNPEPVILEIGTVPARAGAVSFFSFGDLFLAERLPAESILGPQVRQKDETRTGKTPKDVPRPRKRTADFAPGSFTLIPERDPDRGRAAKGRKPKGWKEKVRAQRRKGDSR
jgi:putative RNA 2'-phosphotransferase